MNTQMCLVATSYTDEPKLVGLYKLRNTMKDVVKENKTRYAVTLLKKVDIYSTCWSDPMIFKIMIVLENNSFSCARIKSR